MRKLSNRIIDILSFLGIALVVVFIALAVHYSEYGKPLILYIIPYAALVWGACCFTFTLLFTKKAYNMFISLLLFMFGLLSVAEILVHFTYTFNQYWPVIGIATGIAWLVSGIYKYKKFNLGYTIPSIILVVSGCWYMLFSFKIIKVPFTKVVVLLGPVFVAILVLVAIAYYFIQKKNKKLTIDNEEPEIFDDEELVVTDLENDKEKLEEIKKDLDDLNFRL